jgi:hypothetical protein
MNTVVRGRGEQTPVPIDVHAAHRCLGSAAPEEAALVPGRDFPPPDARAAEHPAEPTVIAAEVDGQTLGADQGPSRPRIPQPSDPVPARRGQQVAAMAEGDMEHVSLVALANNRHAGAGVPHVDQTIAIAAGEPFAIGMPAGTVLAGPG